MTLIFKGVGIIIMMLAPAMGFINESAFWWFYLSGLSVTGIGFVIEEIQK